MTFEVKRKINFYDCDIAGVLFFARIYELCHSAYEELIAGFELEEDYWNNDEYIVPIIKSEASYHRPLRYGEFVTVEIKVAQLKSTSFELNYECKNEKGEITDKVRTVHVCVSKKDWRKRELPAKAFEGFKKYYDQ
jgi:1,4-dihydroxy-2-naphthoyl-CoA hydrolase